MTRATRSAHRLRAREQALKSLEAGESEASLSALDEGQRWVLYAFVKLAQVLEPVPLLRRLVVYLLCHCGMDLRLQLIAKVLHTSLSTLTRMRRQSPEQLWTELRARRAGPAKLRPEHVGPIARYLVEHPAADGRATRVFIKNTLGVSIRRHTLARFVRRYGLGCLQHDGVKPTPLFAEPPPMAAPLC